MATDTWTVTRSTTVPAPPDRVRPLLVDFHEWSRWSPWEDVDPDMDRTFGGAERGPGATYAWSGNRKAGAGSMAVTAATDDRVEIDLVFTKPFKAHNTTWFDLVPTDEGTEVTWTMTGERTLMTRVMGLVRSMDDLIGPDFERGLSRLATAAAAETG